MPTYYQLPWLQKSAQQVCTIHNQYVQAFLYRQGGIEIDESEAEGEDIVAGAELEEFPYRGLSEDCTGQSSSLLASDLSVAGRGNGIAAPIVCVLRLVPRC